jgi:molybdopterin molybdotransferase
MDSLPALEPAREEVSPLEALGRVTVSDILAPHPLPAFPRSTMDGYAVRAEDTFGASESMPGYLRLAGEVAMGAVAEFEIAPGHAAGIHTGGMLPAQANAVIPLEQTQALPNGEIEISRPVAKGENVIAVGEDVQEGQVVIRRGTLLRPAEIGGCMALGITRLSVAVRPKIGILSSGDEVVPADLEPRPGQVRDVNSYTLAALVRQAGGEPRLYGIVPDRLEQMKVMIQQALQECQAVVVTAGSSASARDMTAEAIGACGAPGVLVHGVNVRPGKPTILAVCDGKPVIGLPGNPVSALLIAGLFVRPLIHRLLGLRLDRPVAACEARLSVNVASQAGREDWVPVKLVSQGTDWLAEPIFYKSNLIFSLAAADGLICIPEAVTGLAAGEKVKVHFL